MRVSINGKEHDCEATDLAELWRRETSDLGIDEPRGFAIALNGIVVSRAAWSRTVVREGDAIEIVRAVPGG
jgi:thiamine biosynthesis protein ThiS